MWSSISEEVILEWRPEGNGRGGDANEYLEIIQAEESAIAKAEANCAWQPVEKQVGVATAERGRVRRQGMQLESQPAAHPVGGQVHCMQFEIPKHMPRSH